MAATVEPRLVTSPEFDLVPVRRRDLRRLRRHGPPPGVELPARHADEGDPRYPSRRRFRYGLSIAIDVVMHLFWAFLTIGILLEDPDRSDLVIFLGGFAAYFAVSFVNRVLVQRAAHATLGKALTGLRTIRDDTGDPPTLRTLAQYWLYSFGNAVIAVLLGHPV
ncbi:MAG TPA: RDD family protein [Micromonosporaceae bacterium]|nr:RDD family protein [Micromonosporaceae bacterium]